MAQVIIWTGKLAKHNNWLIPEFKEGLLTYFKKSISKSHKFNHSFFEGLVERDESVASFLQVPLIDSIFDDSIKLINRAPACQILNLSLKRGSKLQDPDELLQKCTNEVIKMLDGEGKLNPLVLSGFLSVIDTLKSHKNYGLEVSAELISSLQTINKKTKQKMPKSGQHALKGLLKGTSNGINLNGIKESKKEKAGKMKVNKNGGKKRKEVPPSKGDEKLKKKKKLIKK